MPAEMPKSAVELTEVCESLQFEAGFSQLWALWALFLRSQGSRSKEAALMALEFEVAALRAGVRRSHYKEVAPGLLLLAACEGSPELQLLSMAGELTTLRRPPVLLCKPAAFATIPDLALAVSELPMLGEGKSWWLDVLLREPQVDASLLPLKHCQGADLALEVMASLATPSLCASLKRESEPGHIRLVAFQANGNSFLLGCEVPELLRPAAMALPLSWHQMWSTRSFKFSAGLDSYVASAVISIAFLECEKRAGTRTALALSLLDACCGSGTLAAVAAASGKFASVIASDIDPTFVTRARENFAFSNLQQHVRVVVHDATTSFVGIVQAPDVVVANPPWGWRIGSGPGTSLQIVRNLLHEFPQAVIAVICPELPLERDVQECGFVLRWSCTLGQSAVWILVPAEPPEKETELCRSADDLAKQTLSGVQAHVYLRFEPTSDTCAKIPSCLALCAAGSFKQSSDRQMRARSQTFSCSRSNHTALAAFWLESSSVALHKQELEGVVLFALPKRLLATTVYLTSVPASVLQPSLTNLE